MAQQHDTARLDGIPRKALAMGSESLRKPLADDELRRLIGRAVERAIAIAGMTKQEVAYAMGYEDNQAPLSRWIAGVETAQFPKLFGVVKLRAALVIALAELSEDISVTTTITIRRSA